MEEYIEMEAEMEIEMKINCSVVKVKIIFFQRHESTQFKFTSKNRSILFMGDSLYFESF